MKKLIHDWQICNTRQRVKFVITLILMIVSGVASAVTLIKSIATDSYDTLLISYALFVALVVLSLIPLEPEEKESK